MFKNRVFQSKMVVFGLIAAFSFLVLPKEGLAQASGSMTGFIYGADMKTPVQSAVVKLRNVQDGNEFQSRPTDAAGLYSLKAVPAGWYVMGVSDPKGDYNFDYEIMVKGGEIVKLAVALTPTTAKSGQDQDQDKEKRRKKAFFLTPLGIALLVAAGGLLMYGGIQLFGEGEKSPSKK